MRSGGGGGVLGNKGNTTSRRGKKGGVLGNKGNAATGPSKVEAGRRGAVRRSTNIVLIVKNPWLDMILSGSKTWEIRGVHTKKRGKIHLALSGGGGRIVGGCRLVDSFPIDRAELEKHVDKHCIDNTNTITYPRPHAWVMLDPVRYDKPFAYKHPYGAIKWVKLG